MVNATQPDAIDILSEIPAAGTYAPQPETTTLDSGPASATSELYRAAIGAVSTDYYLRVFERFEATERTTFTWNWAAAFLTFNWLVFRQLWVAAVVYGGLLVTGLVAIFGLGRLVFHWSSALETGLLALLAVMAVLVPGAFGNALLHSVIRKKMAQALAANTTVPEACAMLDRQASTKQRLIWIALANALVVGATVGISIALPDADRLPLNTPTIEQTRTVTTAPITVASAPEVQASATQVQASASIAPASAPSSAPASGSSAPAFAPTPTPQPALIAKEPVAVTPPAAAISTPPAPSIVEKPIAPEKPADKAANNVASKTTEKTKTNEATDGKKIYINVGLFAKESNARNAHDKLTKAGLPAKEQQVTGSKGTFTRVRVGPYKTLAQAEKAAEKIKSQGLEAVVVRQ